jgi:hypothetical protein
MIMKAVVWAATLVLAGTGVAAAAQEAQPAQSPPEQPEEKKVCRTERATGSLTRRTRVCMTAAQWREINAKTYKGVTEMQGTASGSQAIPNNPGAGG